jgi:hypothetical protein
MNYYIDGSLIRFAGQNCSGYFHELYEGPERDAYDAWVAEGNTAEEWRPEQ